MIMFITLHDRYKITIESESNDDDLNKLQIIIFNRRISIEEGIFFCKISPVSSFLIFIAYKKKQSFC